MRWWLILLCFVSLLCACDTTPRRADGNGVVLLIVGDSLSAGYGLREPASDGWVALMEQQMRTDGFLVDDQSIVNASVSGETTQGGLERLPPLLETHRPRHVLIELGANDFLRRQPLGQAEANLRRMIAASRESGASVALLAVDFPGFAGLAGGRSLEQLYERIGDELDVPVIAYPLAKIYNQPGMMLEDRTHPSQQAQPLLADNLGTPLRRWLAR